jgi:hypothetical protein
MRWWDLNILLLLIGLLGSGKILASDAGDSDSDKEHEQSEPQNIEIRRAESEDQNEKVDVIIVHDSWENADNPDVKR